MSIYSVNTLGDSGVDATVSGDLAAETADGGGLSLREAVMLANGNTGSDTVTFDAALNGATITLASDEIEITDEITIDGQIDADATPDITIDADGKSRVFNVSPLFNLTPATFEGLEMTGGYTPAAQHDGGGCVVELECSDTYRQYYQQQ